MKKSQKTREKIMETAMKIVAEKGFSASSTKEIAQKAGVSEGTLFKYYGSKDELLKQIVLRTIDDFQNYALTEAIPHTFEKCQGQSVFNLLRELLLERVHFFQQNAPAIRVIIQEMMVNETVRQIFIERIWAKMAQILDKIFDQGKIQGEIRDINNHFLRKAFFGMVFFSFILENVLLLDKKTQCTEEYSLEEEVDAMLNMFYYGIKGE